MMMIPCINMVQILVRNVTEYRVHRMIYQEKVWPKHAKSLVSRHMVIGFCFERRPAKCGRWRHAHYWWGRVGPLNCSSGCSDVVPLSVELPRKWFSSKNQQEICVYIYIYHPRGMWRLFGLQKRLSIKSIILSAPGLCRGDSHPLTWYNPCLFGCFFSPPT